MGRAHSRRNFCRGLSGSVLGFWLPPLQPAALASAVFSASPARTQRRITSDHTDSLGLRRWYRRDLRDGYVLGNGLMYVVAGLGHDLDRSKKSVLTTVAAPLTRIGWVIGPTYAFGNLGWGWEVEASDGDLPVEWSQEQVHSPESRDGFWGVDCRTSALDMKVSDVLLPGAPVLLRRLVLSRHLASKPERVRLRIPVRADPRNVAGMIDSDGRPRLSDTPVLSPERSIQAFNDQKAIVTVAAQRALFRDDATPLPDSATYREMFPARALASAVTAPDAADVSLQAYSFVIDFDTLRPGESRTAYIWLVAVTAADQELEATALSELNRWCSRDPAALLTHAHLSSPEPLLTRTDGAADAMLQTIEASSSLVRACQARAGGVMAHPYMYPMYYVRDQYSLVRLFLVRGEPDRAWQILAFHLGMAAKFGLQNAYDTFAAAPDPTRWPRAPGVVDGAHRVAEVPSYMILEGREYYRFTGDLPRLKSIYPQLAFNLRVQQPSRYGLFPSPGDESYDNSEATAPKYKAEMTDSTLLFIAAADFMSGLAEKLNLMPDRAEFHYRAKKAHAALMQRLWLSDREHFAYARDDSLDPTHVDPRPVLDSLLRRTWLGMGMPRDSISIGCLTAVMQTLVDPVRVVADADFTAGMDPGYLLYVLASAQDLRMHDAAELVLRYASEHKTFSEYYRHHGGVITPVSANLRPWESGVNAAALIHYLIGLQVDLAAYRVMLAPHLPDTWPGWQSRSFDLSGEGQFWARFERVSVDQLRLTIERRGGGRTLDVAIEVAGLLRPLLRASRPLKVSGGGATGSVCLAPSQRWSGCLWLS